MDQRAIDVIRNLVTNSGNLLIENAGSILVIGNTFNKRLKDLANNTTNATYNTADKKITYNPLDYKMINSDGQETTYDLYIDSILNFLCIY